MRDDYISRLSYDLHRINVHPRPRSHCSEELFLSQGFHLLVKVVMPSWKHREIATKWGRPWAEHNSHQNSEFADEEGCRGVGEFRVPFAFRYNWDQ